MPYKDIKKQREKQAAWARKARKEKKDYISKLKIYIRSCKEVPCGDCGLEYPFYTMDFDHVRGKKDFEMSEIHVGRVVPRLELVKKEIAKCEVVCANCHRRRTHSNCLKSQASLF